MIDLVWNVLNNNLAAHGRAPFSPDSRRGFFYLKVVLYLFLTIGGQRNEKITTQRSINVGEF